jgi:serine/threonine protein kinase/Tfp pilus assembly protein PilF
MLDDRRILDAYPLPIARGYLRYRNAREVRERHDAAYYLFEIYLKYAALIAIAAYLEGEARDHRVNAVLKGLQRPSLGEWLRFLRECVRFLAREEAAGCPDAIVIELAALLDTKQAGWEETTRLYNALRSLRTTSRSDKGQVTLEMLLGEVVAYRNQLIGHGAPRDGEHYGRFAELLGAAFPEVLRASPFLTACRLVQFDTVQVEDGARLECSVLELMGQNPVRRGKPLVLPYGDDAPKKRSLYLAGPDEKLRLLEPLLIEHSGDVYFLNEADGSPEYLSYTSGGRYKPSAFGSAQGELFERILGYRVDSSQLGRIGEDVAAAASAALAPPAAATERLGDYRILRELGRGAMGIVFEAVQESLGRRVALKVLPGNFALEPRRVERFYREARAAARVHHPSIIPVYEVGEADGTHYYAMEFIDGPSLSALIDEARRSEAKKARPGSSSGDPAYIGRVVAEMASLAEGLEKTHEHGLIHRDVKPSNILVDSTGRYVLVDFGLVREEAAETITRSGEMVGTLAYMSPEQVSRHRVDARADVYSLGATLYEALTLRPPFEGGARPRGGPAGGDFALQRAILFEDPVPARKLNPRLHRDLETILLRALEKNPERRYPSAGELAADLRRFLRYEPIRAKSRSLWTRIGRRAARHRGKLAAAAAIATLVLICGWLAVSSYREARRRELLEYEPQVLRAAMKLQLGRLPERVGMLGVQNVDPRGLFVRSSAQILTPELRRDPVDEALRELSVAAAAVPGRPDAYYYRARGLRLLGRDGEALGELERAVAGGREFVPARVLRASILSARGDAEAARRELEQAEGSAEAGWAKAWLNAHDGAARKEWKAAAEAFGELIRAHAGAREPYLGFAVEVRLGRGAARLEEGDFAGAIEDFSWAAGQWPAALEPLLLLGKAYHLQGEKAKAEEIFEGAWERASHRDEVAFAVAALYQGSGDDDAGLLWSRKLADEGLRDRMQAGFLCLQRQWEEAIQLLEQAIQRQERDALALNLLGWALLDGRKAFAEAAGVFDRALAADRDLLGAHLGKAAVLEREGKSAEALALYKEIAGRRPRDPWPQYFLGWFLRDEGKAGEALEAFQKAVALHPTNGEFHRSLGTVLFAQSRLQEALEALRSAVRYDRRSPWAANSLGWFLMRSLRWDEAEKALNEAIRLGPTLAQPCRSLGEVYYNTGNFEEALKWFQEGIRRDPEHAGTYGILAHALGTKGRHAESAAAYRKLIEAMGLGGWLMGIHETLFGLFSVEQKPPELLAEFDGMAETIENLLPQRPDEPPLLAVHALCLMHAPARTNVNKALDVARRAIELAEKVAPAYLSPPGRYPSYLSILAEAHAASGQFSEAVRILEEAMRHPAARPQLGVGERLEAYRQSALPDLPTLESVDAALAGVAPEARRALLEGFSSLATDARCQECLSYLEARIVQIEGQHEEAAHKLQELLASGDRRPLFTLRLAECLRSGGKPLEAEKVLREALDRLDWADDDLRQHWVDVSVKDLGERDIAARLAVVGEGKACAYLDDARWLLGELRAGRPIRINCGGEDYTAKDGALWGRDRFFAGGEARDSLREFFAISEVEGTEDDRLYHTERRFTPGRSAAYRIPLPAGTYRIKLYFLEWNQGDPQVLVFDVTLEGKLVLERYQPRKGGPARADIRTFDGILVADGLLDIELPRGAVHGVNRPRVSAIEVERTR